MINRVLIRVKTVQLLYANLNNPSSSQVLAENELQTSLDKTYELYHWLLQLSVDITNYAVKRIEIGLNKMRPTPEESNPNRRFINNKFAKQLAKNKELAKYVSEHGISWEENNDLVKNLYELICRSDVYKEYMAAPSSDYENDKVFWRRIYKKILMPDKSLDAQIEEINLYWNDDSETVFSFIDKTIKHFCVENEENQPLLPMYRDESDKEFAIQLYKFAIENKDEYMKWIEDTAKNWEVERIAAMDIAIMQAAIAELTHFPTIPVNVTLNEYIEISKFYSTEKSCTFINGVLDSITNKLRKENKLLKVGALVKDDSK